MGYKDKTSERKLMDAIDEMAHTWTDEFYLKCCTVAIKQRNDREYYNDARSLMKSIQPYNDREIRLCMRRVSRELMLSDSLIQKLVNSIRLLNSE